jgi:hypothetical protein
VRNKKTFLLNLIAIFSTLTAFSSAPNAEPAKKWDNCSKNSECVLQSDHCRSPMGINKNLVDEYNKFIEGLKATISCNGLVAGNWPEDPKMITVKCIKSLCIPVRLDKKSEPNPKNKKSH